MTMIVSKPEDANVEYIDSVQNNWTPEVAILRFVQKSTVEPADPNDNDPEIHGRLVKQMAFSWPHLVRLRDLLDKTIREGGESVINETLKSFGEDEDVAG